MLKSHQTTSEAQKQRLSRNVRAECNADVLLFATLLGAELHFSKTKMIYVGDKTNVDGVTYTSEDMLSDGLLFECGIRKMWGQKRMSSSTELNVNEILMHKIIQESNVLTLRDEKLPILQSDLQTSPSLVLWGANTKEVTTKESNENCLRKRKTKNKEAAFSNFLSYLLVRKGFKLTCQVMARKMTTRTLHFFVWKSYTLPNGKVVTSDMLLPITQKMRRVIDDIHQKNHAVVLDRFALARMGITNELLIQCGLDYFIQPSSPLICHSPILSQSVFRPCDEESYMVISSDSDYNETSSYSLMH
ncbi:Uncharacterized protein QTN25_001599 [Entamoeba marina]